MIGTSLDSTAMRPGVLPLYTMLLSCMPVMLMSSTMLRCGVEPLPALA